MELHHPQHRQMGEQKLRSFEQEMEHLLAHEQQDSVWVVVKCDRLTVPAAESINQVIEAVDHLRNAHTSLTFAALMAGDHSGDEEARKQRTSQGVVGSPGLTRSKSASKGMHAKRTPLNSPIILKQTPTNILFCRKAPVSVQTSAYG